MPLLSRTLGFAIDPESNIQQPTDGELRERLLLLLEQLLILGGETRGNLPDPPPGHRGVPPILKDLSTDPPPSLDAPPGLGMPQLFPGPEEDEEEEMLRRMLLMRQLQMRQLAIGSGGRRGVQGAPPGPA